jgi:hypothetical protein
MGSWFLFLGLRAPTTFLFVAIGVLTAVAGIGAGVVGVRAAARAKSGRVDLAPSPDLVRRRRLLKAGVVMALLGSIGIVASALFAHSDTVPVDARNAFLTVAAQLAPAVVVVVFAVSLKLGFENRWEIAAGAWFGVGLSVGLAYLCVGVVYLFHPFSLVMALSGFVVAVGGDIAKEAAETIGRAEQAAYALVTAPDPQSHEHQGPVAGDLGLHLRNVHGRAAMPSSVRDKNAVHDALHKSSPNGVSM